MAVWHQHPDRDEVWADTERSRVGVERFEREHECKFLIFDETLINSITLSDLEGREPIMKMGQARWYKKIDPACTYIVALDPSLGTGGDPAAIEILELPSMYQVCEWHHNNTPIQAQVKILRDLCKFIEGEFSKDGLNPSIYYSVENNTIGEAGLVALNEYGEENIKGTFLTEPSGVGKPKRHRKGFTTTNSSKLAACAKLKQLVEADRFTVKSSNLLSELKNFIAAGVTYKAKLGENDDLVIATLLTVRMIQFLQNFDGNIDIKMRENQPDDYEMPMPFIMHMGR
jgi:hypothetical protein